MTSVLSTLCHQGAPYFRGFYLFIYFTLDYYGVCDHQRILKNNVAYTTV